jgi:hypothetical protein
MSDVREETLELIAELTETAEGILAALECGATVETEADGQAAIDEARELARKLLGGEP